MSDCALSRPKTCRHSNHSDTPSEKTNAAAHQLTIRPKLNHFRTRACPSAKPVLGLSTGRSARKRECRNTHARQPILGTGYQNPATVQHTANKIDRRGFGKVTSGTRYLSVSIPVGMYWHDHLVVGDEIIGVILQRREQEPPEGGIGVKICSPHLDIFPTHDPSNSLGGNTRTAQHIS